MRARIADGAEQALTATPDREETWPYWSSAAGRLVFQVAMQEHDSDLVLWSPESGEERLTNTPARQERWPAWSPVRASLVFAFAGGPGPAGLALADLETEQRHVLARSELPDLFLRPSFSPDGQRIVAQRRAGPSSQLWLMQAGRKPRALTRDPASFDLKPWFTRDGRRVVFSRRPSAGGHFDVWQVPTAGGEPRRLLGGPDSDDHSARPSPTREELAFVSERDGTAAVYLVGMDGQGLRKLSREPGRSHRAPRWSPDGERLVVNSSPAGAPRVRLTDAENLARSRLVVLDRQGNELLETRGFMADWMPPWR